MYLLQFHTNSLIVDYIAYSNIEMHKHDRDELIVTFDYSSYFNKMKEIGFYTINVDEITKRIKDTGLIII